MSNITDFLGALAAGKPKRVTLIESGTGTYTPLKPGNLVIVTVQAPGSGGGGNNTGYPSLGGGAGAAGGKRVAQFILFGPVAFELGAPGLGGAHLAQGTAGGSASFGPIVALSGQAGVNSQNGGVVGRGGGSSPPISTPSGSVTSVLDGYTLGGAGGDGGAYGRKPNYATTNTLSGGAKAQSDDAAPGTNGQGTNTSPGGGGGSSDHGSGGTGGNSSAAAANTNGSDGTGYGSGGGGAGGGTAQRSGGKGAPGFIHVAEYEL